MGHFFIFEQANDQDKRLKLRNQTKNWFSKIDISEKCLAHKGLIVDTEAISLCQNTNTRIAKTANCNKRNQLSDTYCVDHLLSKISSEHVTVRSCLSLVERVVLPYFENYFNPNLLKNNDFVCIPLCDGTHFQGYVVNSKVKRIIHFDSLHPNFR